MNDDASDTTVDLYQKDSLSKGRKTDYNDQK